MTLFITHVLFWWYGGLQGIFQHRAGDKQALQKLMMGKYLTTPYVLINIFA
jgi:hypothetical protein